MDKTQKWGCCPLPNVSVLIFSILALQEMKWGYVKFCEWNCHKVVVFFVLFFPLCRQSVAKMEITAVPVDTHVNLTSPPAPGAQMSYPGSPS